MIRRPPRSTLSSSSAASDVYKRQVVHHVDQVVDRVLAAGQLPHLVRDALTGQSAVDLVELHLVGDGFVNVLPEAALAGVDDDQRGVAQPGLLDGPVNGGGPFG